MEEIIKHYYGIDIKNLKSIKNGYVFVYGGVKYYFIKYDRDKSEIGSLFEITNDLFNKNVLIDTFIITNTNEYYVNYNNDVYVLLKVNSIEKDIFNIKDVINFNNKIILNNDYNIHLNWANLWMEKIDIFESEIEDFNNGSDWLIESFNYYIGLAENAISYFNNTINEENIKSVHVNLNHKRMNSTIFSGFINNPLNFTFDYEVRDVAEYFKSCFFDNKAIDNDLYYVIDNCFSKVSLRLLFSRMLYPSFYFDNLEKYLTNSITEKEMYIYNERTLEYEEFLFFIYENINKKFKIPSIDWLCKR